MEKSIHCAKFIFISHLGSDLTPCGLINRHSNQRSQHVRIPQPTDTSQRHKLQIHALKRFTYRFILIGLFSISFIYYGQQPFIYQIDESAGQNGQVVYSAKTNWIGNTIFAKNLVIVQFSVRIFLAVVVLYTVNFFNVLQFKKRLQLRLNILSNSNTSSHRIIITARNISVSQNNGKKCYRCRFWSFILKFWYNFRLVNSRY